MSRSDRRTFLGQVLGGLAATTAVPSALSASGLSGLRPGLHPLPPHAPADEPFWELVKGEFPVRRDLIMMNAANLCPSPFPVIDTVTRLTRDIDADASFQNRGKFGALREAAREAIAGYVNADPAEIAITRNTSESNNSVVNGVTLGPGDEVVLWDQNHPTNNVAWEVRAQRHGFAVSKVSVPPAPASAEDLLAPFAEAMNPNTRVVAFSHVSNASGIMLPAKRLCALARERGALTLVDGAQSFGALDLDLHDMGCDFFTGSSHKWFIGPKEAGVLYVRADQIADLWASDVGVGWRGAVENGARKFENLGQRDDACVAAMGTTMEFRNTIGAARIEARIRELATTIMTQIRDRIPGTTFSTPSDPALNAGVVIFRPPNVEPRELFSRLYTEHHIAGAPTGGMRLAPHIYNTMADVERVVDAVVVEVT